MGGFAWNNPPANNHLDELVYEKLKRVKVLPSDVCSDADFVRRVHIDLTGVPPGILANFATTLVCRPEFLRISLRPWTTEAASV